MNYEVTKSALKKLSYVIASRTKQNSMPEELEIKQAADKIYFVVTDSLVEEIFFAYEHLKPYES